jgi:S1-C subfamily serine protease
MRFQVDYLRNRSVKVISGESVGSGFVATSTGLALTCYHLIEDRDDIVVENVYGNNWPAQFLKGNPDSDYALLCFGEEKVQGIPSVEFGNYDDLREGDEVIFCGFPYGVSHFSVHRGMISSKFIWEAESGRQIKIFEFDGSCNPGHSGAALMSVPDGKIYGIVNAYFGLSSEIEKLESAFRAKADRGVGQIEHFEWDGETHIVNLNKLWADLIHELRLKLNVGIGYAVSLDNISESIQGEMEESREIEAKRGQTPARVVGQ